MVKRVTVSEVRTATDAVRGDLLRRLSSRLAGEAHPIVPSEQNEFFAAIARLGPIADSLGNQDRAPLNVAARALLREGNQSSSPPVQALIIRGWENLAHPDDAVTEVTNMIVRADAEALAQQTAADALHRIRGTSQNHEADARRIAAVVKDASVSGFSRWIAAWGLAAIPGCAPTVRSLLESPDEEVSGFMLDAMASAAPVIGVTQWDGLRDVVASIDHLPRKRNSVQKLLQAFDDDISVQRTIERLETDDEHEVGTALHALHGVSNVRVPRAVAAVAARALAAHNGPRLTGALEVLAQQGPTRESLDVFQLVLQSGTFLEPKQLHHVVQGLRRNAGEEAGALLRQAERRYGDERAIDDVTLQILLPNTDDGTPSVEERHLNSRFWRVANEGLDAMVRVAHVSPDHDLQILTLEALRRHPAPLSPPMLEKIITAWTRDPSFRGSSGRTVPDAAVDVLIANGSAEARKLLTKYLISDETAPSTRRAIVQRFGQEIPDVILDVAMSETVDLALRTTAVVELAEFTLHPDRYPPPSITAELGG